MDLEGSCGAEVSVSGEFKISGKVLTCRFLVGTKFWGKL